MQRQTPSTTAGIDCGVAIEDPERNIMALKVLGQYETTDACADNQNGRIRHGEQGMVRSSSNTVQFDRLSIYTTLALSYPARTLLRTKSHNESCHLAS